MTDFYRKIAVVRIDKLRERFESVGLSELIPIEVDFDDVEPLPYDSDGNRCLPHDADEKLANKKSVKSVVSRNETAGFWQDSGLGKYKKGVTDS